MDLPIRFPTQTEVIDEEVARFRSLSPGDRLASIRGLLSFGQRLVLGSDKADFMVAHSLEQEATGRRATQEFIARHGY